MRNFSSYSSDDNGKLRVEVIVVTSLDAILTVDVLTANNNDLNLVETLARPLQVNCCLVLTE